jgi:hypothetical protein
MGKRMALRKVCNKYRPYSNCVTLRGQLANWTSEDIVAIATKNIETIIEPIRDELAEQTVWDDIDKSEVSGGQESDSDMGFGSIGDSLKEEENKDEGYDWEQLLAPAKEEEKQVANYEWRKL